MDAYVLSFQVKSFQNSITENIGVFRGGPGVPLLSLDKKILDFMGDFFLFENPEKTWIDAPLRRILDPQLKRSVTE